MKNKRKYILRAGTALSIILLLTVLIVTNSFGPVPTSQTVIPANNSAKLVYTQTSVFLEKLEKNDTDISEISGIYYGSLMPGSEKTAGISSPYSAELHKFLCKALSNFNDPENSGYYFAEIQSGEIIRTYWCKEKILLKNIDRLMEFNFKEPEQDTQNNNYLEKNRIGGYPKAIYYIETGKEDIENAIRLGIYYLACLLPAVISLIIYRKTAPKNKNIETA